MRKSKRAPSSLKRLAEIDAVPTELDAQLFSLTIFVPCHLVFLGGDTKLWQIVQYRRIGAALRRRAQG